MDTTYQASFAVTASTTLFLIWIVYLVSLTIIRLYFSPISKFPGPKLAALSQWYEFYYDVVLRGQFTFQIQKMHKKYGPIIRITPFELHIEDSDYFDELYSRSNKYDRYAWMSARFGDSTNTFATGPSALHAIRRAPLSAMFSKRSMTRFEPMIRQKVELMCEKITAFAHDNRKGKESLPLSSAYQAFAGDVIMQYCFGFCYDQLKSERFEENFHKTWVATSEFGHLAIQFPSMYGIVNSLPKWMAKRIMPDLRMLLMLQKDIRANITKIINFEKELHIDSKHPTIFHELLQSNLPPAEKTPKRLGDEGQLMMGAGVESTAWASTVISFYLISNPPILAKLRAELKAAIPNAKAQPNAVILEKLPYLSACIQEGLRLSNSLAGRSPRISPSKPMKYGNWTIPAGIPVSMTFLTVHNDEEIFPNSREFIPDRWLGNRKTEAGQSLNRYFVAFGRGPRSCLGINLAHTEILLLIATVFRRFEFELFETDLTDIELKHALFIPLPKMDSKGLRVKVLESL